MMTRFGDLPVRRKLLLMSLGSTTAALLLTSVGFLTWDVFRFRSDLHRDLRALSLVVAENSVASLQFEDAKVAGEILQPLAARSAVEMACLYDVKEAVFASFEPGPEERCPPAPPERSRLGWDAFEITTPVVFEGSAVGTLLIQRPLTDLYARLRVGAAIILGLLMIGFAAAFLMTSRLQRTIESPLHKLAETARTISTSRNYSLRAESAFKDEVGVVVQAFNEMLDRIVEAIERERDANRVKDEFLATLSHELRTPLNAVLGWSRMVRSGKLDAASQAHALETIERNAHAQTKLIEDLLDMSRIVSGRPGLRVREADLAAIVEASVDVIRPAAAAKQLQINVEIPTRPAYTYGDPGRLQQIAWNLLSNAVKFTPAHGRIRVRLESDDGYRLLVEDTGRGIDAAFLPFVFERFRQADGTTTREFGGLGLGLAIVRQLVELHGGTISVRSPGLGRGTTFEVLFPSVVQEPESAVSGALPAPAMEINEELLAGLKVLVVDDEEDTRRLLDTMLTQYGAEVTAAASVKEALDSMDETVPDVLLSDIAMPEEGGHVLIERLRNRPPAKGGHVPAVAVSAYASVGDGLAAEAAGYQAFVTKPFEPAELANLVALLGRTGGDRGAARF